MSTVHANDSQSNLVKAGVDPVRDGLNALISGKDVEETVYGKKVIDESGQDYGDFNSDDNENSVSIEDNDNNAEPDSSEDKDEQLSDIEVKSNDSVKKKSDIEEIYVKTDNGRTKLKIDYANKQAIKDAYLKAAGMRKFQAERDNFLKLVRPYEQQHGKPVKDILNDYQALKKDMDKLERIWQEKGAKGLIKALGGNDEAWKKAVDDELKHREYLANLTAEERYNLELQNREKVWQEQLAEERRQRDMFQQEIAKKEEQTLTKSLESKLVPAFDRYRFAGKLNDPVAEHEFDEDVWNRVTTYLAELPDDIELSQGLIDKTFREAFARKQKFIKVQAETQVKKIIDKKKADAAQRAQVVAKKGVTSNKSSEKFMNDLKSGNIRSSFMDVFTGKIKLK